MGISHPFPAQAFGSRPLRSKGDDAAGSGGRDWYHPATYELRCGAEALAALRHAEAHPGAWWISKPRAGSRGQGVRVDASLAPALAVDEACPRVAQRYVRDVALYRGRKFDVRFLVLVRRLEGDALCARLWRDFWVGIKQRAGSSRPNFRTLSLGHIEVDSADFWTSRLLSSSSRSTTEESGPSRSITLKSG